ncbi:MAG: Ig-like domain-containing protein [Bacillota bacterium]
MIMLSGTNYRYLLSTITVLLLLLLLKPGNALANNPSLSPSPVMGPPGTMVTLTGTGFPAGKSGMAWFDTNMDGVKNANEPDIAANTDGEGKLSTVGALTAPSASPGYYPIRVKLSVDSGYLETYTLFYISRPNMTLGLSSGPPGTGIIISGVNFAPNKGGWVWFDKNKNFIKDPEEPAMWVTADNRGDFKATLIIPNVPPDSYPVLADLPDDGNNDGWTSFIVVPQLTVNPGSGTPGTVISVTGLGLGSGVLWFDTDNDNIVDSNEPSTTVHEEQGRITASLAVPNVAPGTYKVKLSINGNVQQSENFTVKGPALTLNTSKALPGQSIVVTGVRFPPNATGRIWFDTNGNLVRDPGELDKKIVTGNAGDFITSIYVPSVQSGVYAIRAELPEGAVFKPAVSVSVMPAPTITLNLNNGPAGTIVVVNGKHFKPRTYGIIWFDTDGDAQKDSKEKSVKAVTDEHGTFRSVFSVPENVKPGAYCIYADIPAWGKPEAWADFFVNAVNPAYPGVLDISSAAPFDGAVYVHRLPTLKLMFNTTIVKGPDFGSIGLSDEDGNTVKVNVTLSGKTLSIRPVGLLKGEKTYVLLIPALAALDTMGSGMAEDFIVTFTTRR